MNDYFSITEFAEFARVTRATLIHYDKIGLIKPAIRGENGYRFYSAAQSAQINVVRTFQSLGASLEDILAYTNGRTPQSALEMMTRQIDSIDAKIEEWIRARELLVTLKTALDETIGEDENAVTVRFEPARHIIMGQPNDYSGGRDINDALFDFYRACHAQDPNMDMNYPVWGVFEEERIRNGDYRWPTRFYFNNPLGADVRPAATYAIGYVRGGYGASEGGVYARILGYIEENGYELCGPAFEEYPQNEIAVADSEKYLTRVLITVKKKI